MNPPAFVLEGVNKSYPVFQGGVTILKDINFHVRQGEFVAIMGPSGSGKSTLLHILGCLDNPTQGTVTVLGKNTATLTDDQLAALRARAMGFIFQRFHLLPCYDALANVAISMVYSGMHDPKKRARALLEKLGLGHRLHHRPNALSGGEQQRVAIARAMANEPRLILADEPTGALDQANGRFVLALLENFHKQGKTILLVTHDNEVAHRAERVVEIMDGQIRKDRRLRA